MGFYGNHFSFDGIPCEEFGLAIYDIEGNSQGSSVDIASSGTIVEDWIPMKSRSFFYGVQQNKALTFTMVFGVNPELTRQGVFPTMEDYLDRWEIARISNWLTGHKDKRSWLEIEQADMETVRFYCTITELKLITHAWYPWAFSCTVTCDSPYGYMFPKKYSYDCSGGLTAELRSKSMINSDYYPVFVIQPRSAGKISILNQSDNSREFLLNSQLPFVEDEAITVDNDRGIIKSSDDRNLYDYFNFSFFRLKPGQNRLIMNGDFKLDIICEFPVNVGG